MTHELTPKTALVAGATGLIGTQLLAMLLASPEYDKVIATVRKPLGFSHPKLDERVIDFESLPAGLEGVNADHSSCCLGTTLKAAGSKERQYRIDHDYVVGFARASLVAGAERFAVVSSIGADAGSSNFYLRTKGEMERDLKTLSFRGLLIFQPSLLMGARKEFRAGEKTAISVMRVLNPLMIGMLRKYRGVESHGVAGAMIRAMQSEESGCRIIPSDQIR